MIDILKKHFDDFVFEARVKPAIVAGLPTFVIAASKGLLDKEWSEAAITVFLSVIIIGFLAYIIRELGKNFEEKLFKEIGGKPTTIILRFSDNTINMVSKLKYHHWLNSKINGLLLPLSLEEEENDLKSDEKYESAITFLRTYANSHRDELPRVYQELKKYNYHRNLYGCKWHVLFIYLLLIGYEAFIIVFPEFKQTHTVSFLCCKELLILLLWSIIFCSVVTKKAVMRNAYDYAITLVETIEILP